MVVKMMNWKPWPPLSSTKFQVTIVVCCLHGLPEQTEGSKLGVQVKWKGSVKPRNRLNFKRGSVKRDLTNEKSLNDDGVVEWNEEFESVCDLVGFRDGCFRRWEVALQVFDGLNQGPKRWNEVVATGSLNLAEIASVEHKKTPINIRLSMPNNIDCSPILSVSLSLVQIKNAHNITELTQRSMNEDEPTGLKAGLKKTKIFKVIMSKNQAKKACHEEEGSFGKSSVKTDSSDYPFDSDSYDGSDGIDSEEIDYSDSIVKSSFGYESLAYANHAGGLLDFKSNGGQGEDMIYFQSHSKTKKSEDLGEFVSVDRSESQSLKKGLFPWRKRKLSFRSPKAKGEPLLKRGGGEGGDDIDFDRRMLTSSDESSHGWHRSDDGSTTSRSSVSEFGDDNFIIGTWETKEIINRDGNMKLATQVFFASIDQRSEKAGGESACTSLVVTIANWLQNNRQQLPIKSELDTLIRQGSLEWRNMCQNEDYKKRFQDKHFDLETVLESTPRNLELIPEKSFVGFFQLEDGGFDFLTGAMSFDNIWDEISQTESNFDIEPVVYIVSWNDHFFVLKVEKDAYYIIDTLGERLYEGCSQAYVLRFDQNTRIEEKSNERELTVFKGKESCKEYIKRFLAAIPLRELQADVKKGLMSASSPLVHHRLQIEFHHTKGLQPLTLTDE